MKRAVALAILFALSIFVDAAFASVRGDVKKANLLYNDKKYDEAIKRYEAALNKNGGSGLVNFNLGGALYKKGLHNKSIDAFNKAIASGRSGLIAAADYNIGNSLYRIGSSKGSSDARGRYEAALQFYKRSIDLNPKDRDAKFNYEFVERKLKESSETKEDQKKEEVKEKSKEGRKKQEEEQKGGGEGQKKESEGGGSQGEKSEKKEERKQKEEARAKSEEKKQ